jgi:hypothetical protein
MKLSAVQTASHWYDRSGVPCHQVEMKTKPGQMRDTNVGDAIKLKLIPSVTNILNIVSAERLVAWRIDQAILASITINREPGEDDKAFITRILIDMDKERDDAAKLGSAIHECVANYLVLGDRDCESQAGILSVPFYDWAEKNIFDVHYSEQVKVGEGYAGTIDLKAEVSGYGLCIADFKSRKSKDGKFAVYSKDRRQLAAYRAADAISHKPADKCLSVLINSKEVSEPFIHEWPHDAIESGYRAFLACIEVWADEKKYDPRNP